MQRLRWLDSKHRGILQFTEWLAKNQDRYRARVFGPILCEINVQDPTHQRFVEQQIGSKRLCLCSLDVDQASLACQVCLFSSEASSTGTRSCRQPAWQAGHDQSDSDQAAQHQHLSA